ncbi:MAG TPA: T9SS type A sorting domain-containing protein, partial [Catalimonadaceae bacterium]|nr:T9SS type A sorting domain-containing protein [Catalimonadaceae bacterium]
RAHIYFDRNAAVTTEYVHSPIAVLGTPTGTETRVHTGNRLILAPNPASGTVKIWFTNSRATVQNPVPVYITSLDGRSVKQISYNGVQTEVTGLQPGVYIVQSAGSKPQKLIIVQ